MNQRTSPRPYPQGVPPESLAIAHVTPYPWGGGRHEITTYVERVTGELAARGHRVLIVAPSRSQDAVRETRQAMRAARDDPASLLPEPGAPPRVLAVGDALPDLPGARRRMPALPVDVSRTIEDLVTIVPLDICHVHEPFAPSTSSAALRHSRALNVGTFHAPTERLLSTQVARKVVQLVLGRLDARTASFATTCGLMQHYFPADYRVLSPGADPPLPRGSSCARCASWSRTTTGTSPSSRRAGRRAARRCGPTSRSACASSSPRSWPRTRRSRAWTCSSPPPTAPRRRRRSCCGR
jgi:hypothetical protein